MLSKEQEKHVREIARDIAERAANGEFGWVTGVNGIPWEEYQKMRENISPSLRLVDGKFVSIKED